MSAQIIMLLIAINTIVVLLNVGIFVLGVIRDRRRYDYYKGNDLRINLLNPKGSKVKSADNPIQNSSVRYLDGVGKKPDTPKPKSPLTTKC